MKNILQTLITITFLFGLVTTSFGQIYMDGDSTDWVDYPILTGAPNNEDGMFPSEVGAAVTDIVDIKYVKATVIDNILYGYIELWGGPAWPNGRYENDIEPSSYYESRGYYRLLLDIDNDIYTGWDTALLERHYSPVGYLMTIVDPYYPIGAEIIYEWNARMNDDWRLGNEGDDAINELKYRGLDFEEYNGEVDTGSTYLVFNMAVPDADSARAMKWEGFLKIDSSDDELLLNDTLRSYWSGHAWGYSFLEFGIELTPYQKYYMHKDGRSVLQPGDVIGLAGMVETSYDDWGIDMTAQGIINITVDVSDTEPAIVNNFCLSQNYPNPFNPSTTLSYSIPERGMVELKVYDVLGREVAVLVNEEQSAGTYSVQFTTHHGGQGNNLQLTSGVYFYQLRCGGFVESRKMVLLR